MGFAVTVALACRAFDARCPFLPAHAPASRNVLRIVAACASIPTRRFNSAAISASVAVGRSATIARRSSQCSSPIFGGRPPAAMSPVPRACSPAQGYEKTLFCLHPLNVTAETADSYALVYAGLRRKGQPIPTNDLWIAASALEHGTALLSLDTHYAQVDGLRLGRHMGDFLP